MDKDKEFNFDHVLKMSMKENNPNLKISKKNEKPKQDKKQDILLKSREMKKEK